MELEFKLLKEILAEQKKTNMLLDQLINEPKIEDEQPVEALKKRSDLRGVRNKQNKATHIS